MILAAIALVLLLVLTALIGLLWLNAHEYKPDSREPAALSRSLSLTPGRGQPIELYSWNIGYASLDASQDFFMDGGKGVMPATDRNVEENTWAIQAFLSAASGDIIFLQEVDVNAKRSYGFDQAGYFSETWKGSAAFAYNYKCPFVPVPFPRFLGKIESGILTLNSYTSTAERISLPGSFSWPERLAQLKRCLLVERVPLQDGGAELVLVNLHLDAYDSGGSGRAAQTRVLAEFLAAEYAAGNYCVAGGDFNQVFPEFKDIFPLGDSEFFTPGLLDGSLFGEGWQLGMDPSTPSCRSLDKPYEGAPDHQLYLIDGFILSPNVELISVQAQDLGFKNSDHNPVKLTFSLK
ncbi:endonuclease subunit UvrC [Spirochaetia bacterium]|nr:endonuclease subunit UvrC [Spirochaetia bacterium]GHV86308.1 endonuclease subunit UvrC [Spirochaetia bacterium]